jgi:DNA-binding Xre family transcriptional regulator
MIVKFNLKEMIHRRGMTYSQFGEKFNPPLDVPQVSRMAKSSSITFERLAQICEALGITPEELPELIKMYEEKK